MKLSRRLAFLALLCFAAAGRAADRAPLLLGIPPHLGTPAAVLRYQPLQLYLQQRLQRPVRLHTTPDQQSFVERLRRGDFGLAVVPPHSARLAQLEAGYLPIAVSRSETVAVIVVGKQSAYRQISHLRGGVIAAPERLSLATMLGLDLLHGSELEEGRDFTLRELPLHISAVLAVTQDRAAAAITGWKTLNRMPRAVQNGVRVLAKAQPVADAVYLAHPSAVQSDGIDLAQALFDFVNQTEAGKQFMQALGQDGLRPAQAGELEKFDRYAAQLKSRLGQAI